MQRVPLKCSAEHFSAYTYVEAIHVWGKNHSLKLEILVPNPNKRFGIVPNATI